MTTQDRLVNLLQKLELIEATYGREMPLVKREVAELIRESRANPTMTVPAGILCGSFEFQREAAPDVRREPPIGEGEAVDSSAMIPAASRPGCYEAMDDV